MKNLTKKIITIISCFVIIICIILLLIFTVMLSKGLAIVSYIIYSINIFFYCYLIISIFLIEKIKCFFKKVRPFIFLLFFISIFCGNFVFAINFSFYSRYKIICPFTLKDIEFKSHIERRCELYNKNLNSRYSYQYICSYNPIKDFKKLILDKKEYDTSNKLDLIRCVPVNNILSDNDIIYEFSHEYYDIDKYYCSVVYEPKKNNYVNYKECHKNKSAIYILALIFNFFQLVFLLIYFYACRKIGNDNNLNLNRENRQNEIEMLYGLNRMLILLRDLLNMNMANMNVSNISTERTERENNEENLEVEKTKNIIIDNNTKYEIEVNINNLYKEKQEDKNSISLDQINLNIQSEDNLIKGKLDSLENDG